MMTTSDVVIVGAGVSGLYAAYLLKNKGFTVKILEASERHGGRIYSVSAPWGVFIEGGAEFIHGKRSILFELIKHTQLNWFREKNKKALYFNKELIPYRKALNSPLLKTVFSTWESLWKYEGEEKTLRSFFEENQWYSSLKNILEGFSVEYGTDSSKLGLKSLAYEENLWSAGEKNYKLNIPLIQVFDEFYEYVSDEIIFSTTVVDIDYSMNTTVLLDAKNNEYYANKVILTVSLTILKKRYINFSPPLPSEKLHSIQTIGMDMVGMKIFLKFKKSFWKKKIQTIYGGRLCPEYYVYKKHDEACDNTLVAYLMGESALHLAEYNDKKKCSLLLKELNDLFNSSSSFDNFEESFIIDWGKMPFINGTYSYAALNSIGKREILAMPIQKKIYFAGEATNFNGHAATLHGAMESAQRVVEEIQSH